ncbi:MAG: hypothetical protein OFPI_13500 [Osedax symbiont Rs2]|nr:MAG: hypothetical protein OFPI_13500 [Osedax symbiont Rs2]
MSAFILSQLLIVIAIGSDLASFQYKSKAKIVACLCISGVLITLHFILLQQYTAAALMALATVRFFSSLFTSAPAMMLLFATLSVLISAFTYVDALAIISCCGSLLHTIAAFCKNDQRLRQWMLLGSVFWLLHNYLLGSPAAVLMEILFIASNLVGYYRYYLRPSTEKQPRNS